MGAAFSCGGGGGTDGRCDLMLLEAKHFVVQAKKAEKEFRALQSSVGHALVGQNHVLDAPLPRVINDVNAVGPAERIGGQYFSAEKVPKVKDDLIMNLEKDVYGPLKQWLDRYNSMLVKHKDLQRLHSHLLSCQKRVASLSRKVESLEAKAGDPKSADKLEQTKSELQGAEQAVREAEQEYNKEEAVEHAELTELLRHAAYLRTFIKVGLGHIGSAFSTASGTLQDVVLQEAPKVAVPAVSLPVAPVVAAPAPAPVPVPAAALAAAPAPAQLEESQLEAEHAALEAEHAALEAEAGASSPVQPSPVPASPAPVSPAPASPTSPKAFPQQPPAPMPPVPMAPPAVAQPMPAAAPVPMPMPSSAKAAHPMPMPLSMPPQPMGMPVGLPSPGGPVPPETPGKP